MGAHDEVVVLQLPEVEASCSKSPSSERWGEPSADEALADHIKQLPKKATVSLRHAKIRLCGYDLHSSLG